MFLPGNNYVSEHTQFIRDLLRKRPDLADKQREGRAMWWDKDPAELMQERAMGSEGVAAKAYPYDDNKRG